MQAASHLMPGVQGPIQFNCLSIKYMIESLIPYKENTPLSTLPEGKTLARIRRYTLSLAHKKTAVSSQALETAAFFY